MRLVMAGTEKVQNLYKTVPSNMRSHSFLNSLRACDFLMLAWTRTVKFP